MAETISNVAAELNLALMQGKYWSSVLTIRDAEESPVDITGFSFRGHIRKTATSALIASFAFTVLDGAAGTVRVELTSDQTVLLTSSRYVYDWEYANLLGEEYALVRGLISVTGEVTHD